MAPRRDNKKHLTCVQYKKKSLANSLHYLSNTLSFETKNNLVDFKQRQKLYGTRLGLTPTDGIARVILKNPATLETSKYSNRFAIFWMAFTHRKRKKTKLIALLNGLSKISAKKHSTHAVKRRLKKSIYPLK